MGLWGVGIRAMQQSKSRQPLKVCVSRAGHIVCGCCMCGFTQRGWISFMGRWWGGVKGSEFKFPSTRLMSFGARRSDRSSAGSDFFGPGGRWAGRGSLGSLAARHAGRVACVGWAGRVGSAWQYSIHGAGCARRGVYDRVAGRDERGCEGSISGPGISKFELCLENTWRLSSFSALAIASKI